MAHLPVVCEHGVLQHLSTHKPFHGCLLYPLRHPTSNRANSCRFTSGLKIDFFPAGLPYLASATQPFPASNSSRMPPCYQAAQCLQFVLQCRAQGRRFHPRPTTGQAVVVPYSHSISSSMCPLPLSSPPKHTAHHIERPPLRAVTRDVVHLSLR